MNEKYYLRRFYKVLANEATDTYYWFDIEKYISLAAKYEFKGKLLKTKIELVENDLAKVPSYKTIERVKGFFDGEKESGTKKGKTCIKDKSITFETAKELGKALCDGDEYGLLIKIERSNIMNVMEQAEEIWGSNDLNFIYKLMNKILYELESSVYYSYKPGTEEDGFSYYDMKLQNIRTEIDARFWNKKSIKDKLYRLVEEEEILVKSYSQPGAPERWIEANPKLRYFDCVFDFMKDNPELYETIKNGEISIANGLVVSFSFYPTKQECDERERYFSEAIAKNCKQNSQYSLDRLYQNELVEAFGKVFENDFMYRNGTR